MPQVRQVFCLDTVQVNLVSGDRLTDHGGSACLSFTGRCAGSLFFAGRVSLDPDPSPTAMYETKALFGSGLSFVVKRTFRLFAKVHAGARRTANPLADNHSFVVKQTFQLFSKVHAV